MQALTMNETFGNLVLNFLAILVTNKKVIRRVNEDRQYYWILFGKGNIDGLDMF